MILDPAALCANFCQQPLASSDGDATAAKISAATRVIEAMSYQSSLLAISAGVAALRAGESGHAFAVIANEVRGLAQRGADLAKELQALLPETPDVAHARDAAGGDTAAAVTVQASTMQAQSVIGLLEFYSPEKRSLR